MPKSSFVDFKAIKAAITMEQVLQHYGLIDQFKKVGDSLSGPCPIHKGSNPTQFRVSVSKNIWNCFSECKHGGNTLDFITRMENVSIHAAAMKAIEWFSLDPGAMSANSEQETEAPSEPAKKSDAPKSKPTAKPAPAPENCAPNKPLKFRLDKLERDHPYLAQRGLTPETLVDFGIGYCAKGMMAERIAIPIHNPEGNFDCMKLHQHNYHKVVALMGSTMSAAQEELIRKHTDRKSQVIVMLDEDEAGRAGREDIAVRLAKFVFVKVHTFDKEGRQPENLSAEEVAALLI